MTAGEFTLESNAGANLRPVKGSVVGTGRRHWLVQGDNGVIAPLRHSWGDNINNAVSRGWQLWAPVWWCRYVGIEYDDLGQPDPPASKPMLCLRCGSALSEIGEPTQ